MALFPAQNSVIIGYVDISISGVAINNADSGWYYGYKTWTTSEIPAGATVFSIVEFNFDANVMVSLSPSKIVLRSPVSKTMGANRDVRVFYYI